MPHMNGRQRKYKKKTKKGGRNLSPRSTMASSSPMPSNRDGVEQNNKGDTPTSIENINKKMTPTPGFMSGLISRIKMPKMPKMPNMDGIFSTEKATYNARGGKRRRTRKKNRKNKKSKKRRRRKGSR